MNFKTNKTDYYWLITGGAGFIGSHFIDTCIKYGAKSITVLDLLTYSGSTDNIPNHESVKFVKGDICDKKLVAKLLVENKITHLVNFAAESHVDNSINSSAEFIRTNINGTHSLLEASHDYFKKNSNFRYIQVSTDEVFGSLGENDPAFTENSQISPNSPYSASKASADTLVNAWHHTYDLPTIITHCSNNYGPRQHNEKLIPHMINKALCGEKLPVYGDGQNIRDWIYVTDHAEGVYLSAVNGKLGHRYCLGGNCEKRNLDIVKTICSHLDELKPRSDGKSYHEQISFVIDRLGHDYRYAINDEKAKNQLDFKRQINFDDGLKQTIKWYLDN